jgi:hypothetical protein
MRPSLSYLRQIAGLLLMMIVGSAVFAEDYSNCPKTTKDKRPALALIEGRMDGSTLWVAHFGDGEVHKEKIISSKYLQVTQINNAVFLVTASTTARDGKAYAVDLAAGAIMLVAENTRIHCLRSETKRGLAMLMDSDMGAGKVRLIELDLQDLKTKIRCVLSKELLGDKFTGIGPTMKLSPDFRYIVYASRQGEKHHESWSQYTLRLLDLSTMEVSDLDNSVIVEISPFSSFAYGRPAFEWISNDEILYQNIVANEPNGSAVLKHDALHIFKKANVKTRQIVELFRKDLPLTLDGGSLHCNCLNGELIYNDAWVLDAEKQTLTPKELPFSIVKDYSTRQTRVLYGSSVLYSGGENCISTCVSSSHRSFAYSLRPRRETLDVKVYAKIEGVSEPLKSAEGPYSPTGPVGWIE